MRFDRAAFLDRDGTLIHDAEYLSDPDRIEFFPGAFEALRILRDIGYRLVVVTNQSGIARGLYSLEQYRAMEARMEALLAEQGIRLDGVYFCPHHPDFTGQCDCRKPGIGMYRDAARNLGLDLTASVYIGDRFRDIEPARQLGGTGILVLTGAGREEADRVPPDVDVVTDVLAAARQLAAKKGAAP